MYSKNILTNEFQVLTHDFCQLKLLQAILVMTVELDLLFRNNFNEIWKIQKNLQMHHSIWNNWEERKMSLKEFEYLFFGFWATVQHVQSSIVSRRSYLAGRQQSFLWIRAIVRRPPSNGHPWFNNLHFSTFLHHLLAGCCCQLISTSPVRMGARSFVCLF